MNKYEYKNLVFEGGGVKGLAYIGALEELELNGVLNNIENVAGTSAGAITATLLALGYTSAEIRMIMYDVNFNDFVDKSKYKIKNLYDIITKFGISKGNIFKNWINTLIYKKLNTHYATFTTLNNYKQNTKYMLFRNLKIVGTNLSKKRVEIFSFQTTPDMLIADAVRISMSIPLFFQSVKYNNNIYVDGSLFWNYPLTIYDKNNVINLDTLGLRIDSTSTNSVILKKISILNYLHMLVDIILNQQNSKHIHSADWGRTISIPDENISAINFNISEFNKNKLIKSGVISVLKYFQTIFK